MENKSLFYKKVAIVFVILFVVLAILLLIGMQNENQPQTQNQSIPALSERVKTKDQNNVLSFTGNQAGYSQKFTITSKEIKFDSRCDNGPIVCVAWLYQVGGAKQQLFRSSGSTGNFSEQKTLSIGPGTFYIEMDTRDREYKIDVFQSTIPVSSEEMSSAQAKVDNSKKHTTVIGFKLIDENMILGMLRYIYETNDGIYVVELQIDPKVTNFKLESQYNLSKRSLSINGIGIQYAFNEGSKLNGVELFKPYEDTEFTFVTGDKTHVGFVRKIKKDSNKEGDRVGIEATLKAFVNALVPNIVGVK